MIASGLHVLAIYDFRSKQKFIYRTNQMKEITGASELIAGMYERFISAGVDGVPLRDDWASINPLELGCFKSTDGSSVAGEVVYEGGGNLLVLYPDIETFKRANRQFSRIVIENAYTLPMISAGVVWEESGDESCSDFEWNRRRAYRQLDLVKRTGSQNPPCNVLPFTQVSRATFQPIVKKGHSGDEDRTQESILKRRAFDAMPRERQSMGKFLDDLGTENGSDSLIAVLYFDGNSIGDRVKTVLSDSEAAGKDPVAAIRDFSKSLHESLVEKTEEGMISAIARLPEKYQGCRIIVDHGDEITLVCNAHAAPFALDAYFSALEGTGYHACGGMAICHSHDPFAQVYRIAEECCESGKKENRRVQKLAIASSQSDGVEKPAPKGDANYVDFHFCRSGITGSLEQIRAAQEADIIKRPYRVDRSYSTFIQVGELLAGSAGIQRSDLKELNRAILRGHSWYAPEYERLKAKDFATMSAIESVCCGEGALKPDEIRMAAKSILFDVTSFYDVYDLRFRGLESEVRLHG